MNWSLFSASLYPLNFVAKSLVFCMQFHPKDAMPMHFSVFCSPVLHCVQLGWKLKNWSWINVTFLLEYQKGPLVDPEMERIFQKDANSDILWAI